MNTGFTTLFSADSVKYENVYLRAYESMTALREGIKDYFFTTQKERISRLLNGHQMRFTLKITG